MTEKAVLDRIVDGTQAVLLVGETEAEAIVPVTLLPDGTQPGDWLQVTRGADGTIVALALDPAETESMRERIAAKLAALRQRGCRRRE